MPDLPSLETAATGGVVASVLAACTWLISRFGRAVLAGEQLADKRVASLSADFDTYRTRVNSEVKELHDELDQYRDVLAETRKQLERCQRAQHTNRLEIDRLKAEIVRLGGGL